MQCGLKDLETLLDQFDWFVEASIDGHRYIVYVSYMCSEQDAVVPDFIAGKQVLIHFADKEMVEQKE